MSAFGKFLAILNLLGAAQGVLLALALLTIRRGNRTANCLLAAFVGVISVLVSGAVVFTTRYVLAYPHLSYLHHPFLYLAAPLFYLYVRALTSGQERFERKDWLHFLPFALCVAYLLPFYWQSGGAKLAVLNSAAYDRWYLWRHTLGLVQGIPYLAIAGWHLARYAAGRKEQGSATDKAVMAQLRLMLAGFAVIFAGGVVRHLLVGRNMETNLLLPTFGPVMVYALAYLRLRRPEAFDGGPEPAPAAWPDAPAESTQPVTKYERSTLTPERAEEHLAKLLHAMESERLFTDGELTLQKLAERLSIPAPHLSQIINGRLHQSFSDFINSYRIKAAQEKLLDPANKHYSILAIAEEVGFNSKSTFNAAFKKHTGKTPSEFRENSTALESA